MEKHDGSESAMPSDQTSNSAILDPSLQELVNLCKTKKIEGSKFSISVSVVLCCNGQTIMGTIVSADEWLRWNAQTLSSKLREAPLVKAGTQERIAGGNRFPEVDHDQIEKNVEQFIVNNENRLPRFIHLKDAQIFCGLKEISISGILRLRLDAIEGWCLRN